MLSLRSVCSRCSRTRPAAPGVCCRPWPSTARRPRPRHWRRSTPCTRPPCRGTSSRSAPEDMPSGARRMTSRPPCQSTPDGRPRRPPTSAPTRARPRRLPSGARLQTRSHLDAGLPPCDAPPAGAPPSRIQRGRAQPAGARPSRIRRGGPHRHASGRTRLRRRASGRTGLRRCASGRDGPYPRRRSCRVPSGTSRAPSSPRSCSSSDGAGPPPPPPPPGSVRMNE